MPNLYDFSETEIIAFFLVLLRVSAFVVSWPVFGTPTIPNLLKVLFALTISMMIFPVVDVAGVDAGFSSFDLVGLSFKEVFVGVSLGFLARMFFFAVQIASDIIATSMGLASAQLLNPALGHQTTALEQFKVILASLFYLAIHGHHLFLSGLMDSYRMIPVGQLSLSFTGLSHLGLIFQEIMVIGVKLSAPVLISILFMNVAMAVIGRAVPQINVLITSLPVNILVGFLVMIVGLPLFVWQMEDLLHFSATRVFQILRTF